MTDQDKIEGAAEILMREMGRLGEIINERDALTIAHKLYDIWRERVQVPDLAPGEIAHRFRERYELAPDDADPIVPPLED